MKEHINVSLAGLNSFGIDVKASRLVEFDSAADLINILSGEGSIIAGKWNVLSGGNNILFTKDYDGTLLYPKGEQVEITREDDNHVWLRAQAGADWDQLVEWTVERGYWGLENLSLIPGKVGAAPVQNIGAYSGEVKDSIVSVEMVAVPALKEVVIAAEHCQFGYRDSVFKHHLAGKAIITAVNFKLSKQPQPNLRYSVLREMVEAMGEPSLSNIRRAIIKIRESKLPDPKVVGNAGSFFENPVVAAEVAQSLKEKYPDMPLYPDRSGDGVKLAGGWLIEKAGWKGKTLGKAGVWADQALILVNRGGATGEDIMHLARTIQLQVGEMFGVDLQMEVNMW